MRNEEDRGLMFSLNTMKAGKKIWRDGVGMLYP
jgi:hypothetical protein